MNFFSRLLFVSPDELRRLLPFMGIYTIIFAGLTLADGLAISMVLQRVGSEALPKFYAITAGMNIILIFFYLKASRVMSATKLFQWILGLGMIPFAGAYFNDISQAQPEFVYGAFFVAKEISLVTILMHFGTVLQNYFTHIELNRVLPLIYAGGRIGGLLGAAILAFLAAKIGMSNLLLVYICLAFTAIFGVGVLASSTPQILEESFDSKMEPDSKHRGLFALIRLFQKSPLLSWLTLTGLLFTTCRWLLNFRYSQVFEVSFANEQALASFIGRYTLFATSIAILIQFLLASRMIAKIGLSGTHMLYNIMLVFGFLSQFMVPGVGSAVFARFVETELRFAIRNPVNQLMTNLFSRDLRIVSRAITIGAVNPIAALMASFALMFVGDDPMHPWRITFYILTVGLYLWASMLLYRAIRRHRNDP